MAIGAKWKPGIETVSSTSNFLLGGEVCGGIRPFHFPAGFLLCAGVSDLFPISDQAPSTYVKDGHYFTLNFGGIQILQ